MPARSKKQQRFFKMIRSIQRGLYKGKVPPKLQQTADSMSINDVNDFVFTPQADLVEQVDKKDKD
jgi:hypothetical protein